jgi:death-on-curing protein
MVELKEAGLLELYNIVKTKFPETTSHGKPNYNLIKLIVEKPSLKLYGDNEKYDTVFKKAACLLEGIVRLHPFPDGNKRTALLTTFSYLQANKYYLVIPLDTVRFLVNVAQNPANTEEEIDGLIIKIANWLEERTGKSKEAHDKNIKKYVLNPLLGLLVISLTGIGLFYTSRKLDEWFSTKMHPEYKKDMNEIIKFLINTINDSKKAMK